VGVGGEDGVEAGGCAIRLDGGYEWGVRETRGARNVSGEGGDEHEQGGFGEVEVGEQAADDAEAVAGSEEDGGRAGVGFEVEWWALRPIRSHP
jgi:hypothetical protein